MPAMLDDASLSAYASTFYGFGSYTAPYWFVGMEEGGGGDFNELKQRFVSWESRGRKELEDLREYLALIGYVKWFGEGAKLQKTWSQYIRLMLAAEGEEITIDAVRAFQSKVFGKKGESCLIELLPLPSRSVGDWQYPQWSHLPQLQSRKAYFSYYARSRAEHIRSRMLEHSPKAVVFAGMTPSYVDWWRVITGDPLKLQVIAGKTFYTGVVGRTQCLMMMHPAARGVTHEYFERLGKLLRVSSK